MRIHIARSVKCVVMLALWAIIIAPTTPLRAEPDTVKLKRRLSLQLASLARTIDDIKWSNVNIYRVLDEYKTRLIQPQLAAASKDSGAIALHYVDIFSDGTEAEDFYPKVMKAAARTADRKPEKFIAKIAEQYGKTPDDVDPQVAEQVLNLAVGIYTRRANIPNNYLLVTTRDRTQPLLIALVGIEMTPDGTNFSVKGSPIAGIDMYENLKGSDPTLYDELREAVMGKSQSLQSQLFTLRDLREINIVPHSVGQSKPINEEDYPYLLTSISAGRPLRSIDTNRMAELNISKNTTLPENGGSAMPNAVEAPYEITVGTDILASFTAYKSTPTDTLPFPEADWGVELRSGFDELNYPSIWGGRLTLNAILENIKIGAVLPQFRFGDSSIGTSGFGANHQRVIGGYGLAVSGDFTAPLLASSGLFNFYGTYSFAESNPKQLGIFDVTHEQAYLIRYAAQLFYSFGFYADAEARHLFRLKIGGTAYGVDTYQRDIDTEASGNDPNAAPVTKLNKMKSESFGGISGKIEYMKTGQRIPWGIGVQYLDQSLLSNIWIQFAVTPSFDLKFEGKYFTNLGAKDRLITHPWENPSIVVPSVAVKYHF